MSASWTSRVRFEVRITRGGVSAVIVPISGTVTWKSDRISSRYASNSSSARSISSMSRTGATPSVDSSAWRSGRRIRKSGAEDVVGGRPLGLAARLEQPDLEHLARVVPLVDGGVDVEALVALEPDERVPSEAARTLASSVLPTPASPSSSSGRPSSSARKTAVATRAVGDVVARPEVVLDRLDGARAGGAGVAVGHRQNLHGPVASAVGRVELARVGREAEALAAGEDAAVAEPGDRRSEAGSPDSRRGSSRSAAVAFE